MVTGPYVAIAAIADGWEAAISIDRYLRGLDLKEDRQFPRRLPAGGLRHRRHLSGPHK